MNASEEIRNTAGSSLDQRDMILFGEPYLSEKYDEGIRRFTNMSWKKLDDLIDCNIIDIDRKKAESPVFMKFREYLNYHHLHRCYGYVCCRDKSEDGDSIVIEGIDYKGIVTMEMLTDFVSLFRGADEFKAGINRLYCRYLQG